MCLSIHILFYTASVLILQEQSVIVTVHKFVPEKDTIDPVSGNSRFHFTTSKNLFIINKQFINNLREFLNI